MSPLVISDLHVNGFRLPILTRHTIGQRLDCADPLPLTLTQALGDSSPDSGWFRAVEGRVLGREEIITPDSDQRAGSK